MTLSLRFSIKAVGASSYDSLLLSQILGGSVVGTRCFVYTAKDYGGDPTQFFLSVKVAGEARHSMQLFLTFRSHWNPFSLELVPLPGRAEAAKGGGDCDLSSGAHDRPAIQPGTS